MSFRNKVQASRELHPDLLDFFLLSEARSKAKPGDEYTKITARLEQVRRRVAAKIEERGLTKEQ